MHFLLIFFVLLPPNLQRSRPRALCMLEQLTHKRNLAIRRQSWTVWSSYHLSLTHKCYFHCCFRGSQWVLHWRKQVQMAFWVVKFADPCCKWFFFHEWQVVAHHQEEERWPKRRLAMAGTNQNSSGRGYFCPLQGRKTSLSAKSLGCHQLCQWLRLGLSLTELFTCCLSLSLAATSDRDSVKVRPASGLRISFNYIHVNKCFLGNRTVLDFHREVVKRNK